MQHKTLNIYEVPEMVNYNNFKVVDFIEDEHFLCWVKDPEANIELNRFWIDWFSSAPPNAAQAEEAKIILLNIYSQVENPSEMKQHKLWERIKRSIANCD